jgi:hypothetical protein
MSSKSFGMFPDVPVLLEPPGHQIIDVGVLKFTCSIREPTEKRRSFPFGETKRFSKILVEDVPI